MYKILEGLRVIEASAFVAAPLGGMTLAQLGADVIRFDPIGGGIDARRWPITEHGRSLYWAGLNKGKRSLAIDSSRPEGRELLTALIASPGEGKGIFLTNLRADKGWMSYDELKKHREDLIMVNLLGSSDGTSAVDYTVNCAAGFPFVTGNQPTNNRLTTHDTRSIMSYRHGMPWPGSIWPWPFWRLSVIGVSPAPGNWSDWRCPTSRLR
jgi:2-methylfumaryl-CoA isomerase